MKSQNRKIEIRNEVPEKKLKIKSNLKQNIGMSVNIAFNNTVQKKQNKVIEQKIRNRK